MKVATKIDVEPIVRRPYTIEFEYPDDPEEGVLAYVAEWPDCFAAGRTREEAVKELGKAMRELAAYRLQHKLEIPEPLARYSGRVLLRMPKRIHRDAERRAEAEGVSLNQWLSTTIAQAIGPRRVGRASAGKKAKKSRR